MNAQLLLQTLTEIIMSVLFLLQAIIEIIMHEFMRCIYNRLVGQLYNGDFSIGLQGLIHQLPFNIIVINDYSVWNSSTNSTYISVSGYSSHNVHIQFSAASYAKGMIQLKVNGNIITWAQFQYASTVLATSRSNAAVLKLYQTDETTVAMPRGCTIYGAHSTGFYGLFLGPL